MFVCLYVCVCVCVCRCVCRCVCFYVCYLGLLLLRLLITGAGDAQTALLDHLTAPVLIGHPGGHAHAAGTGAGTPFGRLLNAVEAGVPGIEAHRLLLSVGCKGGQRKLREFNKDVHKDDRMSIKLRGKVYRLSRCCQYCNVDICVVNSCQG